MQANKQAVRTVLSTSKASLSNIVPVGSSLLLVPSSTGTLVETRAMLRVWWEGNLRGVVVAGLLCRE